MPPTVAKWAASVDRQAAIPTFAFAIALVCLLIPTFAHAASAGLPWENPLQQIANSISGPVAKALGVMAIVGAGLAFAFSEGGTILRRVLGVVFGLAIAFGASTFFLSFLGFAGGALVQ